MLLDFYHATYSSYFDFYLALVFDQLVFAGWLNWYAVRASTGYSDSTDLGTVNAKFDELCRTEFSGSRAAWETEIMKYTTIVNYPTAFVNIFGISYAVGGKEDPDVKTPNINQYCYRPYSNQLPTQGHIGCGLTASLGIVPCLYENKGNRVKKTK